MNGLINKHSRQEREPNSSRAYDLRGMYHSEKNEFDLAVDNFRKAILNAPRITVFKYHLIEALLNAGRLSEAEKGQNVFRVR